MIEREALLGFHFVNAVEDGDDVVVEFVRFADWHTVSTAFREFRTHKFPWGCALVRYRVSAKTGRVEELGLRHHIPLGFHGAFTERVAHSGK